MLFANRQKYNTERETFGHLFSMVRSKKNKNERLKRIFLAPPYCVFRKRRTPLCSNNDINDNTNVFKRT